MIFTCFGDMMRVPGSEGTLLEAKAAGADVRMVYSPLDALRIARENPEREVVFFAIGFETTAPSTALTLKRAQRRERHELLCVCNHVTIVPPLRALLESPDLRLDGFIGPGHVCTVVGARPFEFIPADYGKPVVVVGLRAARHPAVDPDDPAPARRGSLRGREPVRAVVPYEGNLRALEVHGRGLRAAPPLRVARPRLHLDSALKLVAERTPTSTPSSASACPGVRVADPKACQCGEVLKGVIKPWECKVFGTACTPEHAIGTCMVSPRAPARPTTTTAATRASGRRVMSRPAADRP